MLAKLELFFYLHQILTLDWLETTHIYCFFLIINVLYLITERVLMTSSFIILDTIDSPLCFRQIAYQPVRSWLGAPSQAIYLHQLLCILSWRKPQIYCFLSECFLKNSVIILTLFMVPKCYRKRQTNNRIPIMFVLPNLLNTPPQYPQHPHPLQKKENKQKGLFRV